MKRLALRMMIAGFACAMSLVPGAGRADSNGTAGVKTPPPVEQELVREGDFAVRLVAALGMGTAGSETEAESRLTEAGITPRNGWIADYPVTPDIFGEIDRSVRAAAGGGTLGLSVESAVERLDNVMAQAGLSLAPSSPGTTGGGGYSGGGNAPDEAVIDDYYTNEGPPIITYYSPPADYSYLYAWVPYPFWCYGFWYPGYYILNDFDRVVYVGHRGAFVSNHFRDIGGRRYTRIDPVARFNGRPAMTAGGTVRSGVPPAALSRGGRGFGGGNTPHLAPNSRFSAPASRSGGTVRGRGAFNAPPAAPGRAVTQQRSVYGGNGAPSAAYRGGMASSSGMGRSFGSAPMSHGGMGGGSFRGGGMTSSGFHGGGFSGGGFSGGRGHR